MLTVLWQTKTMVSFPPVDKHVANEHHIIRSHDATQENCPRVAHFNTPNANMADHSVGARDESNGSEASEALMFCFENASPENSCFVVICSVLFRCAHELLCFWMRREGIEIFHCSPLRENSGSMQFVETKRRSSQSPRELIKVCLLRFRIEDLRKIV